MDKRAVPEKPILCPSAQPDEEGAQVFGVMIDTPEAGMRVGYLTEAQPVTPDIVAASQPARPGRGAARRRPLHGWRMRPFRRVRLQARGARHQHARPGGECAAALRDPADLPLVPPGRPRRLHAVPPGGHRIAREHGPAEAGGGGGNPRVSRSGGVAAGTRSVAPASL